ncbi:MAG: dipeptide epimerase [Hyphomonadaceae bacterium JAD_PAG50586_4]|nr:MAG: dipeptide epimerase [Hyphomonadaceae bacterium JAD_PAG50586_4]
MIEGSVELRITHETWPLAEPLRIAFATIEAVDVVVAELYDGQHLGRGEGIGVFYRDDNAQRGVVELQGAAAALAAGQAYDAVFAQLKSYAARTAVDCAAWDLKCKQTKSSIWELTGVSPGRIETFSTISLDLPQNMAASARMRPGLRLKLKIDATNPVGQVEAVRRARPDAILIADANQAFSFAQLQDVAPALAQLGLALLEQPLASGADEALEGYRCAVPLAADESCFEISDLDLAARRYDVINVKLDKTGGLTEALRLERESRRRGLKTMVGCMAGTSLSMAPGFVVARAGVSFVDLDGPVLLAQDRSGGATYAGEVVTPPARSFWG